MKPPAIAPDDYTSRSGTLTFAPNETSKSVAVTTIDDSEEESDERLFLQLSSISGNAKFDSQQGQGRGLIWDNDSPAVVNGRPLALAADGSSVAFIEGLPENCAHGLRSRTKVSGVGFGVARAETGRLGSPASGDCRASRLLLRPSRRDFARTDEALRLRHVGEFNYITYKGPKLDATTKTRREIEIGLADGHQAATDAGRAARGPGLHAGGRSPQATRSFYGALARSRDWRIAGRRRGLGQFRGTGNHGERARCGSGPRACSRLLAGQLGLSNSERRSYLELLLAKRSGSRACRSLTSRPKHFAR